MRTEWVGRNSQKDKLRKDIWTKLKETGIAIGDPFNEIPNFVGAEEAAARLRELDIWKKATVVKCNPDHAQIPVRRMALEDGKILYMAVPQLVDEKCFVELTKEALAEKGKLPSDAETWEAALKLGKKIAFEDMTHIDIAVVGCVAVTIEGARIGKGGGFADLEFGILRYYHLIDEATEILTTVHDEVIVELSEIPLQEHDTFLNYIITPSAVHKVDVKRPQPEGIHWESVQDDQLQEIPILLKLKKMQPQSGRS